MANPKTARIPLPEPPYPEQVAEDLKTTFGDQEPFALFKAMATSERSWAKFRGGSLLDGRLITMREREIIIDRTCARTRCEWEWGVHIMLFAEKAGLSNEDVAETLRVPADLSRWSTSEAALIRTVDAFHEHNTLTDDEFADLAQYFDTDQIIEIIMLTGHYHTISYLCSGLGLPLQDGAPRFADYERGLRQTA